MANRHDKEPGPGAAGLRRLRGFQDLRAEQARAAERVETVCRQVARLHNAAEIRIPALEPLELYRRTSGESSDVVEKQMFAFALREPDDDEQSGADNTIAPAGQSPGHPELAAWAALRPEGTPGVVRAYVEAGLDRSDPEQRLYYLGPMFRRERPQKGRFRQFTQFGVEIFGRPDPLCDAELIEMVDEIARPLGVALRFEVNSLGCPVCRPAFRAALLEYGRARLESLCADCRRRLERNPLRLLDCKTDVEVASQAPQTLDFLCVECRAHFVALGKLLGAVGLNFEVNPRLVRGLDYYCRTAFEAASPALGAQNAVAAGGRYDGLVEALGGAAVAGSGFALGVERMALLLPAEPAGDGPEVALIALGERAVEQAVAMARGLRALGLGVETLAPTRSLKAMLRRADRSGARYAVIVGERELERDVVQLRDLRQSSQREVRTAELAAVLGGQGVA